MEQVCIENSDHIGFLLVFYRRAFLDVVFLSNAICPHRLDQTVLQRAGVARRGGATTDALPLEAVPPVGSPLALPHRISLVFHQGITLCITQYSQRCIFVPIVLGPAQRYIGRCPLVRIVYASGSYISRSREGVPVERELRGGQKKESGGGGRGGGGGGGGGKEGGSGDGGNLTTPSQMLGNKTQTRTHK